MINLQCILHKWTIHEQYTDGINEPINNIKLHSCIHFKTINRKYTLKKHFIASQGIDIMLHSLYTFKHDEKKGI